MTLQTVVGGWAHRRCRWTRRPAAASLRSALRPPAHPHAPPPQGTRPTPGCRCRRCRAPGSASRARQPPRAAGTPTVRRTTLRTPAREERLCELRRRREMCLVLQAGGGKADLEASLLDFLPRRPACCPPTQPTLHRRRRRRAPRRVLRHGGAELLPGLAATPPRLDAGGSTLGPRRQPVQRIVHLPTKCEHRTWRSGQPLAWWWP